MPSEAAEGVKQSDINLACQARWRRPEASVALDGQNETSVGGFSWSLAAVPPLWSSLHEGKNHSVIVISPSTATSLSHQLHSLEILPFYI